MTRLTPKEQSRHDARAQRLRRERLRRARQRAAIVFLLVALLVAGAAFALRPPSAPASPASGGTGASSSTRTADASPSVETSHASGATGSTVASATHAASDAATRTPAPPAPIKRLSPAPGVKTIVVDKSDQKVTLYKANGKPVERFPCASGVIYPRVGSYKVWGRSEQSWALADDTTFYYFTKFATSDKGNSIGFHSVPQNPDGSLVGKLGKPVSHGCVRLEKSKARFVYTWAVNGTRVVVRQ